MRLITIVMLVLLFAGGSCLYAADDQKGASQQAYEHASDKAIFNRVGNWFATLGKSEEEKAKILAEREAQRAQRRAEQQAKKTEKMTDKEMKKAGATAEKMKDKVKAPKMK